MEHLGFSIVEIPAIKDGEHVGELAVIFNGLRMYRLWISLFQDAGDYEAVMFLN
jgi:hypothetical protein